MSSPRYMSQSSAGLDTPEPDLAASLSSLAASFASQYSPLEFIVKALVTRLHHVENVVGIGPGAPKGAVTLESRIADMEKEMKTLAHNISGFEEPDDIFGGGSEEVTPYEPPQPPPASGSKRQLKGGKSGRKKGSSGGGGGGAAGAGDGGWAESLRGDDDDGHARPSLSRGSSRRSGPGTRPGSKGSTRPSSRGTDTAETPTGRGGSRKKLGSKQSMRKKGRHTSAGPKDELFRDDEYHDGGTDWQSELRGGGGGSMKSMPLRREAGENHHDYLPDVDEGDASASGSASAASMSETDGGKKRRRRKRRGQTPTNAAGAAADGGGDFPPRPASRDSTGIFGSGEASKDGSAAPSVKHPDASGPSSDEPSDDDSDVGESEAKQATFSVEASGGGDESAAPAPRPGTSESEKGRREAERAERRKRKEERAAKRAAKAAKKAEKKAAKKKAKADKKAAAAEAAAKAKVEAQGASTAAMEAQAMAGDDADKPKLDKAAASEPSSDSSSSSDTDSSTDDDGYAEAAAETAAAAAAAAAAEARKAAEAALAQTVDERNAMAADMEKQRQLEEEERRARKAAERAARAAAKAQRKADRQKQRQLERDTRNALRASLREEGKGEEGYETVSTHDSGSEGSHSPASGGEARDALAPLPGESGFGDGGGAASMTPARKRWRRAIMRVRLLLRMKTTQSLTKQKLSRKDTVAARLERLEKSAQGRVDVLARELDVLRKSQGELLRRNEELNAEVERLRGQQNEEHEGTDKRLVYVEDTLSSTQSLVNKALNLADKNKPSSDIPTGLVEMLNEAKLDMTNRALGMRKDLQAAEARVDEVQQRANKADQERDDLRASIGDTLTLARENEARIAAELAKLAKSGVDKNKVNRALEAFEAEVTRLKKVAATMEKGLLAEIEARKSGDADLEAKLTSVHATVGQVQQEVGRDRRAVADHVDALRREIAQALAEAEVTAARLLAEEKDRMEAAEAARRKAAEDEEARKAAEQEDGETAQRLFRQQMRAAVAEHETRLDTVGKEVKQVKFIATAKLSPDDADDKIAAAVKPFATRDEVERKAESKDVEHVVAVLGQRIQDVADDQEAMNALAALRREVEQRTAGKADTEMVSDMFRRLEDGMDAYAHRQDFVAHMNTLRLLMNTKVRREDLDGGLDMLRRQVAALQDGNASALEGELMAMRREIDMKADRGEIERIRPAPPRLPDDVLLTTVRCLSCNQPRPVVRPRTVGAGMTAPARGYDDGAPFLTSASMEVREHAISSAPGGRGRADTFGSFPPPGTPGAPTAAFGLGPGDDSEELPESARAAPGRSREGSTDYSMGAGHPRGMMMPNAPVSVGAHPSSPAQLRTAKKRPLSTLAPIQSPVQSPGYPIASGAARPNTSGSTPLGQSSLNPAPGGWTVAGDSPSAVPMSSSHTRSQSAVPGARPGRGGGGSGASRPISHERGMRAKTSLMLPQKGYPLRKPVS